MKQIRFQRKKIILLLKIFLTTFITLFFFFFIKTIIVDENSIIEITNSSGNLGPIVLILLIGFGILFTPIPSILFIVVAGYLYGTLFGAIYSYIGHLVAATGTFLIAKKLKLRKEKYKELIEKNKKLLYFLYVIPIIPISVTSILYAHTKMNLKQFFKIIFISFIPLVLFFSYFGNEIIPKNLLLGLIIFGIILILSFIILKIIKIKLIKKTNNS